MKKNKKQSIIKETINDLKAKFGYADGCPLDYRKDPLKELEEFVMSAILSIFCLIFFSIIFLIFH